MKLVEKINGNVLVRLIVRKGQSGWEIKEVHMSRYSLMNGFLSSTLPTGVSFSSLVALRKALSIWGKSAHRV